MSLTKLESNWFRYGNGIPWRVAAPHYMCEVGREGNFPLFSDPITINKIKKVKAFYQSRLQLSTLNQFGYGIDLMVANSFAESGGNVPTAISSDELKAVFARSGSRDTRNGLNEVVLYLNSRKDTKGLVRREPGYIDPISTPSKISLGAHQVLLSTALWLNGKRPPYSDSDIADLVFRLPSESKFAAGFAEKYFARQISKHFLQPPLMAACYNAGSLRVSSANVWGLASHGSHIDRWVQFFNTSRSIDKPSIINSTNGAVDVVPAINTSGTSVGNTEITVERVLTAMRRMKYLINETDDKPYNINIIGLRNPKGQLNVFDDKLIVIWKSNGVWNQKLFTITTEPGARFINSAQEGGQLLNPLGTAIMVPGQYINSHSLGTHKGYEALKQSGKIRVYRDANKNNKLDYDNATIYEVGAEAAVNIHRANPSRKSMQVDSWSAGCQVFADPNEFSEFMSICKKSAENFGKKFTYTLMMWSDL